MTLVEALLKIKTEYNVDILNEYRRVEAYLYDIVPNLHSDIKNLQVIHDKNFINTFTGVIDNPDLVYKRALNYLIKEKHYQEAFSHEILGIIYSVLEISMDDKKIESFNDSLNEENKERIIKDIPSKITKIYSYEDGGKYNGEVDEKHKWRNGWGRYVFGNDYVKEFKGLTYEGEWKNNHMEGSGKLFYPNGNVLYDGEWEKGCRSGHGVMYSPKGKILYSGLWKDDRKIKTDKMFNFLGNFCTILFFIAFIFSVIFPIVLKITYDINYLYFFIVFFSFIVLGVLNFGLGKHLLKSKKETRTQIIFLKFPWKDVIITGIVTFTLIPIILWYVSTGIKYLF